MTLRTTQIGLYNFSPKQGFHPHKGFHTKILSPPQKPTKRWKRQSWVLGSEIGSLKRDFPSERNKQKAIRFSSAFTGQVFCFCFYFCLFSNLRFSSSIQLLSLWFCFTIFLALASFGFLTWLSQVSGKCKSSRRMFSSLNMYPNFLFLSNTTFNVYFNVNIKLLTLNIFPFTLKAMVLQYPNVTFANVDVNESRVRILIHVDI